MHIVARLIAAAALVMAAGSFAHAQTPIPVPAINLDAAGTPFSKGVRGQAIPSINQYRPPATIGTQMSLDIARGSSLRGVAGGLEADFYDWRTRSNDARSTTLDYLRFARDNNSRLVITANIRGLHEYDPTTPATDDRRFTDTSITTLTKMAADWVRYTNVIAQTYRQGDAISNPQDQAILDSLVWTTAQPNDAHDILPTAAEAPLPKVKYWEIGNEPRVGLTSSYNFTNSYTFLAPGRPVDSTHKYDFHERYASLTSAMRAVDPTIQVGPAMQWLNAVTEQEVLNSILNQQPNGQYLPVDFIGYHPYQTLFSTSSAADIESRLRSVYSTHSSRVANIRAMITASGRDASAVELMASEANVSNHTSNGTVNEARMGHALGTVEEVFSFARLGLSDAHYWLWPGDPYDWTEQPVYKAYEGLRDHMGDTLLSVYSSGNNRLYATRESTSGEIALWGLNFSNSSDALLDLAIEDLPSAGYSAKLMTLGATTGPTTLFSANLPSYLSPTGVATHEVDWQTTLLDGVDLSNYALTVRATTMAVLVITPVPIPPTPGAPGNMIDGFETNEGHFAWPYNQSPTAYTFGLSASTAINRVTSQAQRGGASQELNLAIDAVGDGAWQIRHNSGLGAAAAPAGNTPLAPTGSVGFWLKTNEAGISVRIGIDDPTTTSGTGSTALEVGSWLSVAADDKWHLYQWSFENADLWEAFPGSAGANGEIDATFGTITIDSIFFKGTGNSQIYLDAVSHNPEGPLAAVEMAGDFDGDGVVNSDDLDAWMANFGLPSDAEVEDGDSDEDGDVDGADFLAWQRNLGGPAASAPAATTVPEPTTAVLTLLAAITAARWRTRR